MFGNTIMDNTVYKTTERITPPLICPGCRKPWKNEVKMAGYITISGRDTKSPSLVHKCGCRFVNLTYNEVGPNKVVEVVPA